jgi:hypothetical protein
MNLNMFLKSLRRKAKYLNFIKFLKTQSIAHPVIALSLAYIIWGVSQPITKLAMAEIKPFDLLFFRLVLACVLIFPF